MNAVSTSLPTQTPPESPPYRRASGVRELHNNNSFRSMNAMEVIDQHTAFVSRYNEYRHKIYSYLYYRVGNDQDTAEDLTSDVFIKAYEAYERYDETYAFSTWIYTIARNRLIDHYRTNKPTVSLEDIEVGEDPDELFELIDQELDLQAVTNQMNILSQMQREVITDRFFADKSTQEIADARGISRDAVRQHISRGVKALREAFVSVCLLLSL